MTILDSIINALQLLFTFDPNFWHIVAVSLTVSIQALFYSAIPACILAWVLAFTNFYGKSILQIILNTLLAIPTVVIGLLVYLLLSSQGPLAELHLLFTSSAMVIGQTILCFPVITVLALASIRAVNPQIKETVITLGANYPTRVLYILYEAKSGLIVALLTGFGRVIAEVGISLMVGGNILNHTRNIPTSIILETSKGNFTQGIALGMVLLMFSLIVSVATSKLQ